MQLLQNVGSRSIVLHSTLRLPLHQIRRTRAQAEEPEKIPSPMNEQENLPQEVISKLRDTVFSFDTFFVTSVENYQANGVLFKGNVRGDPAKGFSKLKYRLKEQLGDKYKLYMLENQEEQPVVLVLPESATEVEKPPIPDGVLCLMFGIISLITTLNINDAQIFNAALLIAKFDPTLVAAAAPGSIAFLVSLVAHEAGHSMAAKRRGVTLAPPIFIPSGLGLLGSFGAITRIKSLVPDRETLAAVAVPGPLAGSAFSAVFMLLGLGLTKAGIGGIEVDTASFKDSLMAGALAQATFGDTLFASASVNCNPFFVAGWAGLIVNAINAIPAGELDGGRLFLALFGRRAASRMSTLSYLLLGIFGFNSSLSLFWLLLILFAQRGPIVPCENELTEIQDANLRAACIAALTLPFLVLLPYPSFINNLTDSLM